MGWWGCLWLAAGLSCPFSSPYNPTTWLLRTANPPQAASASQGCGTSPVSQWGGLKLRAGSVRPAQVAQQARNEWSPGLPPRCSAPKGWGAGQLGVLSTGSSVLREGTPLASICGPGPTGLSPESCPGSWLGQLAAGENGLWT